MFKKTGAAIAGCASRLVQRERRRLFVIALGGLSLVTTEKLSAEKLLSALTRAYAGNPDLNQSRAAVRVRDEDMPKALAGIAPIRRRRLRSAQCAVVSGWFGICLDPSGQRAIEPSAAQR